MATISVFEHQILREGELGFTESHRQTLERFIGENDETTFNYYTLVHKGIKFRQYVGVLCLNGVTIEILPKADRGCENKNFWRDKLMFMLSKVYKLDVQSPSTVSQKLRTNSPILDIFIYYCPLNMIIFSQLLEKEELRELLFWTSPLYEFNVSSGGGSAASISISLRSSSGLLKNVCILR